MPSVVVLGGPNGAGKTTAAPRLLRGALRVDEFMNADLLAQGLSVFRPEAAAIDAGRVVLRRLDQLARARISFAFESTLASVTLANKLNAWQKVGDRVHVVYLWLPSVDLALSRVRRWRVYDASPPDGPVLVAAGRGNGGRRILKPQLWEQIAAGAV